MDKCSSLFLTSPHTDKPQNPLKFCKAGKRLSRPKLIFKGISRLRSHTPINNFIRLLLLLFSNLHKRNMATYHKNTNAATNPHHKVPMSATL